MKVALFGKSFSGEQMPFFRLMLEKLQQSNVEILFYRPYYEKVKMYFESISGSKLFNDHQDLPHDTDFLFSIGGDGTLLETLPLVRDSGIPVLGINMGRLGFLSSISKNELGTAIDMLL